MVWLPTLCINGFVIIDTLFIPQTLYEVDHTYAEVAKKAGMQMFRESVLAPISFLIRASRYTLCSLHLYY